MSLKLTTEERAEINPESSIKINEAIIKTQSLVFAKIKDHIQGEIKVFEDSLQRHKGNMEMERIAQGNIGAYKEILRRLM